MNPARAALSAGAIALVLLLLPPGSFAAVSAACGTASGTPFNLEPRNNPQPQNQTPVDFLPGAGIGGADLVVGAADDMRLLTSGSGTAPDFRGVFGMTSQTGFYVHRNASDTNPCAPDFEGGLGPITDQTTGDVLVGVGFPSVAAHAGTQSFFIADTRVGNGEGDASAVGIFRATAANLNDPAVCPDGTLNEAASAQCWPVRVLANRGTTFQRFNTSPQLAVDQRTPGAGTGAGDVYVSVTAFGNIAGVQYSAIFLVACKNDLSTCSPAQAISARDTADLSFVAVRPDGGVTVTYTVQSGGLIGEPATADIKFVACMPGGAPAKPVCAAPSLIATETQAIPFNPFNPQTGVEASQIVLHTYPKHAHRQDQNGTETYVVWERCKVSTAIEYPGLTFVNICPDADLLMAASKDNGQTWSFGDLDTGPQDQLQPWIAADASTNTLNIVYYSSQADTFFQHKLRVMLRQIAPGSSTPDAVGPPQTITTLAMDPSTDPVLQGIFIGHYPGVAARGTGSGSRAYIHHTHTALFGMYHSSTAPEQNNHLSRFDY